MNTNQLNADHFYAIGDTHAVCQDYALSGVRENLAYAIVCDGCSSSEGVDFGARALAYAAKDVVLAHTELFFTNKPEIIGPVIIGKASLIQNFGIPANTLDATLLIAVIRDSKCRVCAWGDGAYILRDHSGSICTLIEYEKNAPFYLNYLLNPTRARDYLENPKTFGTKRLIAKFSSFSKPDFTSTEMEATIPVVFDFLTQAGTSISVISDGITQFRKADSVLIPYTELIDEFTGFKTLTGVFVTRRMKAMLAAMAKRQCSHDDDISIASIAQMPSIPQNHA
jgi:hypothetical protein